MSNSKDIYGEHSDREVKTQYDVPESNILFVDVDASGTILDYVKKFKTMLESTPTDDGRILYFTKSDSSKDRRDWDVFFKYVEGTHGMDKQTSIIFRGFIDFNLMQAFKYNFNISIAGDVSIVIENTELYRLLHVFKKSDIFVRACHRYAHITHAVKPHGILDLKDFELEFNTY